MNSLEYQVGGNHYKQFKIQPAEFYSTLELKYNYILNYVQSSTIRYVTRFKLKNGLQDLQKIEHICKIANEFKLPKRRCNTKVLDYTHVFCYENNLPILVTDIVINVVKGDYTTVLSTLKKLMDIEYPEKS